jgi:hypothetical protein
MQTNSANVTPAVKTGKYLKREKDIKVAAKERKKRSTEIHYIMVGLNLQQTKGAT